MAGETPPSDLPTDPTQPHPTPPPGTPGSGSGGSKRSDRELIEGALRAAQPRSKHPVSEDLLPPPDSFPGYEIVREIHRGGQGVVYQAVQKATKRKVAVKVLHMGPFAGSKGRARFEREVAILAQLEHPNIVSILDSGITSESAGKQCFYVMDYVSGHTLDSYVAHSADKPIQDSLSLFLKICDAVNAAHLKGITHRDLKPSNIRVDHNGEPHVLDFGLAKIVTGETTEDDAAHVQMMSMTGQFIGSLPWASPEQAEGAPSKIDIRSDVYSLGVVLYQLLTGGKFPYQVVGNMRDVMDNILRAEPARPSTIRKRINDEVETIILKTLQKDRDRRYQSAGELAKDIRRYLSGESIEAMRDSGWYLVRKAVRRHKFGFGAAAAALLVLIAVSAYAYWNGVQLKRLADEKEEALKQREEALEKQRQAQESEAAFRRLFDVRTTLGRQLAYDALARTSRNIKELLGSTQARAELLESAKTYLSMIKRDLKDDPGYLTDLALMHELLGELEAGLYVPRIDRDNATASGIQNYDEAIRIRKLLVDREPADSAVRAGLAGALTLRAKAKHGQNDLKGAETDCDSALELVQAILSGPDKPIPALREKLDDQLAVLTTFRGDLFYAQAKRLANTPEQSAAADELMKQGEEWYDRGTVLWKALLAAAPTNEDNLRAVWVCTDKVARVQIEHGEKLLTDAEALVDAGKVSEAVVKIGIATGRFEKGRDLATTSLEAITALLANRPHDPRLARDRFVLLHNIGRAIMNMAHGNRDVADADPLYAGRREDARRLYEEALVWFNQAVNVTRSLSAADPVNVDAKRDVAMCLNKVGNCTRELARFDESVLAFQESLVLREDIYKSDKTARHQRDVALALQKLGRTKMLEARDQPGLPPDQSQRLLASAHGLLKRSLDEYDALAKAGTMPAAHQDIAEVKGYALECEKLLKK